MMTPVWVITICLAVYWPDKFQRATKPSEIAACSSFIQTKILDDQCSSRLPPFSQPKAFSLSGMAEHCMNATSRSVLREEGRPYEKLSAYDYLGR